MPLTDAQCRSAKSKNKPYKLTDFEGLYLEVMPTGSKYWRLKYRLHGKEKRISLGAYPAVPLIEARQKKSIIKEEVKQGIDPVLSRLEQQQTAAFAASQSFELIAREWHGKQIEQWKPEYAQTVLHRLEKYLFSDLGSYPIRSIKPLVILQCLQKIEKTNPDITRRLKRYCHHIFAYAMITARADHDPTYGLEHALRKYRKGHYASISVDVLPKFMMDLHDHKAKLSRQTTLAIRLMFLTFIRTSELTKAKWSEIDLERAMWTIPAERMKMNRPHLVPLSRQAINILYELKSMNGNREHIFPSKPRPKDHMSKGTILVALKRMGYENRMTGHGFRALAMGILKEKLGYSHELVKKQLSHAPKDRIDAAYDRAEYLSQRTEMMQRYADYLDEIHIQEMTKRIYSHTHSNNHQ